MSRQRKLCPTNRHLVITPHFPEKKTKSGVYLPEDFVTATEKHIAATIVAVSEDCSENIQCLFSNHDSCQAIIDASMIEQIVVDSESYYVILENYVVGALR